MANVIFDLDGTLVDAIPDLNGATNEVAAEHGLRPLTPAETRSFIGDGVPALVRRSMAALGLPEADFDAWHARFLVLYAARVARESRPYPGAIAALDTLAAGGHRLGICTNKPQKLAEALLEGLGLAARFDTVIGGDTAHGRKPAPGGIAESLRRLGGRPAVMVGDGPGDIRAAHGAGLPVLFFTGGYGSLGPDTPVPEASFADWADAPDLIARLAR